MKNKFILGAAFASAGLAALIGGDCFATPQGWAPISAATIGGGRVMSVCIETGTSYYGAPISVDVVTVGGVDMDYSAQMYFSDFEEQQCKTINLPSGGYHFTVTPPAGAGAMAWNPSNTSNGIMEIWVDLDATGYFAVGGGFTSSATATDAVLKRGREVNLALKALAGTTAEYAIDEDTNIKSISFVDALPNTINPETSNKTLLSDGVIPIYAYNDGENNIYIHKTTENIWVPKDSSYMFAGMSGLTSLTLPNNGLKMTNVVTTSGMFEGMSSLGRLTMPEDFDTSNVEDMSYMFADMSSLTRLELRSSMDTSNVENMISMFSGMSSLSSLTVSSNFNTSNVTDMSSMFEGMSSMRSFPTSVLMRMNTLKVESMSRMFAGMSSVVNIVSLPPNFDTSNVEDMSYMFADMSSAETFTAAVFYTSNATDMTGMFSGMTSLTDVVVGANSFDTPNVVSMRDMFRGDESLSDFDPFGNLDTSKVEDMSGMFYDTAMVSADFASTVYVGSGKTKWDVSNVKDMSCMFAASYLLTDISALASWDVSNVENMSSMFTGWTGSDDKWMTLSDISPLAYWNTSKVTDMNTMFRSNRVLTDLSPLQRTQRNGYVSWDVSNVKSFNDMFMGVVNIATFAPLESWSGHIADDASMYAMFYGIPFATARPSWYDGDGDGEF